MKRSYKELAKIYFLEYRQSLKNNDKIIEDIDSILQDSIEGLSLIEAFVDEASTDSELAYFSAGPFEDFFNAHYNSIADLLKESLRKNAKMRKAITGIWVHKNSKARAVLDELLSFYDLKYGSL